MPTGTSFGTVTANLTAPVAFGAAFMPPFVPEGLALSLGACATAVSPTSSALTAGLEKSSASAPSSAAPDAVTSIVPPRRIPGGVTLNSCGPGCAAATPADRSRPSQGSERRMAGDPEGGGQAGYGRWDKTFPVDEPRP